jgi:hypothetical protein
MAKAKVKRVYRVGQREYENRGRLAEKMMARANLVFIGLVITQAFSDEKDYAIAGAGAALFVGAYLFARHLMKGGEK